MESIDHVSEENQELMQEFMEMIFEKATLDSRKTNEYGLSKYLSEEFTSSYNFGIDIMTFRRYYKGYISKKARKHYPNKEIRNALAGYLGFENFSEFEEKSEFEIVKKKLRKEREEIRRKFKKQTLIGWSFSILLMMVLAFFIAKYYKKNCMIWVDDHFEKIRCSGLDLEEPLVENRLKGFRKVAVCKDSIFIENGEAVKFYLRQGGGIEFFTQDGEHPIYRGKFLDPVTQRIVDNWVKSCDSIFGNTDSSD